MNPGNRNVVVMLWVIFTVLGSAIGLFFGAMAGERLGFSLGESMEGYVQDMIASFPSGYLPNMVAGFIYGTVSGFFPGILQWLGVLRSQFKHSSIWIFLNMFGMAFAFSLNSGVYAFLNSLVSDALVVDFVYMVINGLLTGFIMGLLQWIFFSRKHAKAFWWLILNIVGWSTLSFIGFLGLMLGAFFWAVELTYIVIDSIGFAIFTGIALYITFPQTIQETEGITTN